MSRLQDEYADTPPSKIPDLDDSAFDHVPLPALYEHGGLWNRDSYNEPVRGYNGVVSYPWHKWQGGSGENVDVWLALEFNPALDLGGEGTVGGGTGRVGISMPMREARRYC